MIVASPVYPFHLKTEAEPAVKDNAQNMGNVYDSVIREPLELSDVVIPL
jgi:hypothetical protein